MDMYIHMLYVYKQKLCCRKVLHSTGDKNTSASFLNVENDGFQLVTKSPVISEKFHHILLILNTPTDKQQGLAFAINNKKGVEQRYAQMVWRAGELTNDA